MAESSLKYSELFGLKFVTATTREILENLRGRGARKGLSMYTPNLEFFSIARKNPGFGSILERADILVPDGHGILLLSRALGIPIENKIEGASLLMEYAVEGELKVFLFGGKTGVAERAARQLESTGVEIAGTCDGYEKDEGKIIRMIKESHADIVVVALGCPKQETWIDSHAKELGCICIGCGGFLDVVAGDVKRAPAAMRDRGLEWLYRLAKQPFRWRRILPLPFLLLKMVSIGIARGPKAKEYIGL